MVALVLACLAGAAGCGTEPTPSDVERHPENYRCIIPQADGACLSIPVNCPVTLGRVIPGNHVSCPPPGEIMPIEDDHCTDKRICVD
jgi:hypothetical protein